MWGGAREEGTPLERKSEGEGVKWYGSKHGSIT